MTSTPSFYRVSIAGASGAAPNDGFIDNKKAELYLANAIGPDGINEASLDNLSSFTFTNALAKRRANVRYRQMIAQMGFVGNFDVLNIVANSASANTNASTFTFDMLVAHGDGSLMTNDEINPGTVLTDPATVIARTIARALIQNTTLNIDVLDPTPSTSFGILGASKSVPRYGSRIQTLAIGPVYANLATANAAITITTLYRPTS